MRIRSGSLAVASAMPQPADVDVDGPQLDLLAVRPHRFEQLLAREDPLRILEEMPQQAIFGRAERDRLAVAADPVRDDVHLDPGIAELLGQQASGRDPAQHRVGPRDQLLAG